MPAPSWTRMARCDIAVSFASMQQQHVWCAHYSHMKRRMCATGHDHALDCAHAMQVSTSDPKDQSTAQTLTDGNWHMFTLTTNARGVRGYNIFLDGRLVGSLKQNTTYTSARPTTALPDLYANGLHLTGGLAGSRSMPGPCLQRLHACHGSMTTAQEQLPSVHRHCN